MKTQTPKAKRARNSNGDSRCVQRVVVPPVEPEKCQHSLKRNVPMGGHNCIKCGAYFPYGCMWDEN